MVYSIIIPIYDPEDKQSVMIQNCLRSVYENSKDYEYEVVMVWDTVGFPIAVNEGLKRAKGDYLIILNDDIIVKDSSWLGKLGHEDVITSWRMHPFFMTGDMVPDGACWAMSRKVFNRLGYLDEQFAKGYGFEDSDYWMRAQEEGIPFLDSEVELTHGENQTFQTYFKDNKEEMTTRCQGLFYEKWKHKLEK